MRKTDVLTAVAALAACYSCTAATPLLPGGRWRVHDESRPAPPVVEPGTASTQDAPGQPPADAIVLFDGQDLSGWIQRYTQKQDGKTVQLTREPLCVVEDGAMHIRRDTGDIITKEGFGSCQLHVEWRAPDPQGKSGQSRGNSGVFLMDRYEIQVLDCYENRTYADGQAGAVYGQTPPLVNACRKPGEWQCYDIIFTAPKFEGDKLISPAYFTVLHNGVLIQNHTEVQGPTVWRKLAQYHPHAEKLPIRIQDHSGQVAYRNIWIRPLE